MAKSTSKTNRNGYVLPDDKLQQREAVFVVYQAMGTARSISRLETVLKRDHPKLAVTRAMRESW